MPAQNAAENIAPARVGRQHAVAYESNSGACVVGNDFVRNVTLAW
jgi:hypothetical protein